MYTQEIEIRYSLLAEDSCCLSCGGAINYSNPKSGEKCVDLGCGRGNDVIKLATEVGENGFVTGIDISDVMLEKAQRTANKLRVTNVRFIKAELESLPFENNSVDLVTSNCTINHALDKQAVWNEIYRILKIGGRFVVSDIYSAFEVPEEYRNDQAAIAECWAGATTKYIYLSTLSNAGFDKVEILEESAPYPKGKISVSSFTIAGMKTRSCCCQ